MGPKGPKGPKVSGLHCCIASRKDNNDRGFIILTGSFCAETLRFVSKMPAKQQYISRNAEFR